MKKILPVVNLPQVYHCYELLKDYKMERRNIKRYQASLKNFRDQITANAQMMAQLSKSFTAMKNDQSKPRKTKKSRLDYFMFSGISVYGSLSSFQAKLA